MKHPKTFDFQCDDCGEVEIILVEWKARDAPPKCICGGKRTRLWTSTFSTEKISKSLPAEVAKGRFDGLRRKQELKKEKAKTRQSGDRVSEKKIEAEIKISKKFD